MSEQVRRKPARLRRIAALGTGAAMICAAAYLVQMSGCGIIASDRGIRGDANADSGYRAKWAQRLKLPGLPDLHKVSDNLYRGAQPSAKGMRQLEEMGVKTVVNLRSAHSDSDELEGTALTYERIGLTTRGPNTEDVVRFLRIVTDDSRTPVFVHCQHGADRTGTMCAIYRIAVEGWSKEEAIEEMTKGGFGFHSIWANLPECVRNLNIKEIKHSASLSD
ncbi:MAG: tyrosine-protein phosphatase [Planctomycetota bacterium]